MAVHCTERKYTVMANDSAMLKATFGDRIPSIQQQDMTIREQISRPVAVPSPATGVFEPVHKAATTVMSYNLGK